MKLKNIIIKYSSRYNRVTRLFLDFVFQSNLVEGQSRQTGERELESLPGDTQNPDIYRKTLKMCTIHAWNIPNSEYSEYCSQYSFDNRIEYRSPSAFGSRRFPELKPTIQSGNSDNDDDNER
jgi:hypothetical protein